MIAFTLTQADVLTVREVLMDAYLVASLAAVGAIQEDNQLDLPALLCEQQRIAGALLCLLSTEIPTTT